MAQDLEFPPITDKPEVASEVVDRADITAGKAVVSFSKTEAALADLRERYKGATFDLKTTAGDKAARAARLELVTLRTSLEKRRKEFKAPVIAMGKLIDSEAERITGQIKELEDPIDAQIVADEQRRAAEKAEHEPAPEPVPALLAHIAQAFDCKFPSHPKPSQEWWAELRALADRARSELAA